MATRSVVREDVVQISFEVEDDELQKAQREVNDFTRELKDGLDDGLDMDMSGISGEFNDIQRNIRQTSNEGGKLKNAFKNAFGNNSGVKTAVHSFKDLKNKVKDVYEESNRTKKSFFGLGDAAKGIAGKLGALGGISAVMGNATDKSAAEGKLSGLTGAYGPELDDMKAQMKDVFTDGLGESWDDVAIATAEINKQLGKTGKELSYTTKDALVLRDTFDFDVNESVRTVDMMMKQFGVSSDEAFDVIAKGAQLGLDKNGNLLDSFNEYAVHFKQIGFGANDMMNMFNNAAQQGVFDVDKIGDAVKEFGIKAIDGSKSTAEGFAAIGLDANDMAKKIKAGGETGKQAFGETLQALAKMEDPIKREAAGVALFGTMWEDMGSEAVLAMAKSTDAVDSFSAMDSVSVSKFDDVGAAIKSLGRTINTEFAEIIGPGVTVAIQAIKQFTAGLKGEQTDTAGVANQLGMTMRNAFDGIKKAVEVVGPVIKGLLPVISKAIVPLLPVFGALAAGILAAKVPMMLFAGAVKAFGVYAKVAQMAQMAWKGVMLIFKGVLGAVRIAQMLFNASILTCPITWIVLGIAAIIAAGVLLYKNWDTVKNFLLGIWEAIKGAAASVKDAVVGAFKWLASGVMTAINGLKAGMAVAWNAIKAVVVRIARGLKVMVVAVFKGLKTIVVSIARGIKAGVVAAFNVLKAIVTAVVRTVKTVVVSVWTSIKNTVVNLVKGIKDGVVNAFKAVLNFLKGLGKTFLNAGKNIILGLINGIKSGIGKIGEVIGGIKDKVLGALKWFKFGSPSRRMAQFGEWSIEGFTAGMEEKANAVKQGLSGVLKNPFKDTTNDVLVRSDNDYAPTNGGRVYGNTSTVQDNSQYNPRFNLTVNSSNDRDTERKVKGWVKEAIKDTLDSIGRRNERLTEV